MNIDVNQLAEHFAHTPFQVKGIYKYTKTTGVPHADYTDAFPGFVFPLTGRIQFQFNETPYILSPGKVVHGGAKMKLAKKTIHNTSWEYILVLYQTYGSELEASSFSNQHFALPTGQSPRLNELIMQLWQVYNQPGGIPMFQTEVLFRDVLNEALLSVVNRRTSRDSLPCSRRYPITYMKTIISIIPLPLSQSSMTLIEIVYRMYSNDMPGWDQQNIYPLTA